MEVNNIEQEQFRIVINREANLVLEKIVDQVNEGLDSPDVNRSLLANYVFLNLAKYISESDIREIRSLYFDERKALLNIVKSVGAGEDLPEQLSRALKDYLQLSEPSKKKVVKKTKKISTLKPLDKLEAG